MSTLSKFDFSSALFNFLDSSFSTFHTVKNLRNLLLSAGFIELSEKAAWELSPGDCAFVIRNQSSILAFRQGDFSTVSPSFRIALAHTDSPGLKLKCHAAEQCSSGLRIPVESYGGLINSSWLDRPLGVAGRITLLDSEETEPQLVVSDRALAVIPNPAIHMLNSINDGFKYKPQTHLAALFGEAQLKDLYYELLEDKEAAEKELVAELYLYDTKKACHSGIKNDMILAPKLDNLLSCFAAAMAIKESKTQTHTQVMFLADNEEVGSNTGQGADSAFLRDVLSRLMPKDSCREEFLRALAASKMISADAAHALHPNFTEEYDPAYSPKINEGLVIKSNASQRYASNAITEAEFLRLCKKADIPVQFFAMHSDKRCGSTIGPICSALLGIPTVDIGVPMWAMHSSKESCGSKDPEYLYKAFKVFWRE